MSFRGCNDKLKLSWQRKVPLFAVIVLIVLVLVFWQHNFRKKPLSFSEFALDTMVEIQIWGPGAKEAASLATSEIRRVEGLLSLYQRGSDLGRISQGLGGAVAPDTLVVLGQALQIAKESGGAYDPTVGTLSRLWQKAREEERPPENEQIQKALLPVGWQGVELLPSGEVRLPEGMELDLGGAAKGYAVDRALEVLRERGVKRALINAGGQIGLLGKAPRGSWQIGVRSPRGQGVVAVLNLEGGAVSTSGDYQRFFLYQGKRYHHLLDPRGGYPASSCQSATVVAQTGMMADLLSTACFLLGPSRGLKLVEKYGAQALVVDSNGRIHTTEGLSYTLGEERD